MPVPALSLWLTVLQNWRELALILSGKLWLKTLLFALLTALLFSAAAWWQVRHRSVQPIRFDDRNIRFSYCVPNKA